MFEQNVSEKRGQPVQRWLRVGKVVLITKSQAKGKLRGREIGEAGRLYGAFFAGSWVDGGRPGRRLVFQK